MLIRRCKIVYLEPREQVAFDLAALLAGGSGIRRERHWLALAPHLDEAIEVDATERDLLGNLSADEWIDSRLLAKAEAGYATQNELDPECFRNAAAAVIRAVAAETTHDPVTARFWADTCAACLAELDELAAAGRAGLDAHAHAPPPNDGIQRGNSDLPALSGHVYLR